MGERGALAVMMMMMSWGIYVYISSVYDMMSLVDVDVFLGRG